MNNLPLVEYVTAQQVTGIFVAVFLWQYISTSPLIYGFSIGVLTVFAAAFVGVAVLIAVAIRQFYTDGTLQRLLKVFGKKEKRGDGFNNTLLTIMPQVMGMFGNLLNTPSPREAPHEEPHTVRPLFVGTSNTIPTETPIPGTEPTDLSPMEKVHIPNESCETEPHDCESNPAPPVNIPEEPVHNVSQEPKEDSSHTEVVIRDEDGDENDKPPPDVNNALRIAELIQLLTRKS